MVLEAAGAGSLLNAASTSEGVFSRFPKHFQERFAELVLKRGYDMDVVSSHYSWRLWIRRNAWLVLGLEG